MSKTNKKTISISTEYITLGQLLKYVDLISSGAMAKEYIQEHEIFVNGEYCKMRGKKLYKGYEINIDNSYIFAIDNEG